MCRHPDGTAGCRDRRGDGQREHQYPTDRSGAVLETAANLAKLVGMAAPVFSRTRKQVIEAGWLEETERLGHIRYYRLDPKRMGENVVVPLRRAT
ncbi:replication initiation protein, RepL2 [Streptomyces sp. NPDC050674]|uniref:replication initiation protein, RepL2 n=1 Tax=Streptomyces sp. NPDC050674 TaxID=3157216 RepID=UPI00343B7D28